MSGHSEYEYFSDDKYFKPTADAQKRSDTKEIILHNSNYQPRRGESWDSIRQLVESCDDGNTKLFIVARHGHSEHNQVQEEVGQDYFNAEKQLNSVINDPLLTLMGQDQARVLGGHLNYALQSELKVELNDVAFYSSSLSRCISTAEIATNVMYAGTSSRAQGSKPQVTVLDELREWLGWDHIAGSDRRSSKTKIKSDFSNRQVDLHFREEFPEDDNMMNEIPIQETWVDVRRRWEKALDYIYETNEHKYICVFGNNRSLQCGLDLLRLPQDKHLIEKHKKITVLNMANCSMLALVVRRRPLTKSEAKKKNDRWTTMERQEQPIILALKEKEKEAKRKADAGSR